MDKDHQWRERELEQSGNKLQQFWCQLKVLVSKQRLKAASPQLQLNSILQLVWSSPLVFHF